MDLKIENEQIEFEMSRRPKEGVILGINIRSYDSKEDIMYISIWLDDDEFAQLKAMVIK